MNRTLSSLIAVAMLAGCGGKAAVVGPCTMMRDACLASQMACAATDGVEQCLRCDAGQYPDKTGKCASLGTPAFVHDFEDETINAGEEVLRQCVSWTMNNPTEIWVNTVELEQAVASHHSNWFFVPNNQFNGPDGRWTCADRGFDELRAALAGGVLFAQSTQSQKGVQKLPDGAAIRIPPWSRIIANVHFLNATTQPVTGHYHLAVYDIPAAQVKTRLVPIHEQNLGLAIPPHAQSRFVGACTPGDDYHSQTNMDWDLELFYVLPHTHSMAKKFFIDVAGGALDGQRLVELGPYDGEAHGRSFDPPVSLKGAHGLTYGCEYDSDRDAVVKWGFGDQEMCEFLGYAQSTKAYESTVNVAMPTGTDGTRQVWGGYCESVVFDWDFNKPGGAPM
jgi:hypothetical protein